MVPACERFIKGRPQAIWPFVSSAELVPRMQVIFVCGLDDCNHLDGCAVRFGKSAIGAALQQAPACNPHRYVTSVEVGPWQ